MIPNSAAFTRQFVFRGYFSGEMYRFGFNGKENDNEVKGGGNSLDFGGRIYDSRLGRWLSLDPKADKYPSLSPYNFCANSPIMFVDHDGKDFGFVIDHETKTITIVATVYTVKNDVNMVQATANFWNGQSGKFSYVDGGSGKEYKINFAVNVVVEKTEEKSVDKALRNPTGNSMVSKCDDNSVFIYKNSLESESTTPGFVERGEISLIQASSDNTDTPFHEFGHFLGILEWAKGIMKPGKDKTDVVTAGMLQNVFNSVGVETGLFDGEHDDCPSDEGRDNYKKEKEAHSRQAKSIKVESGCDEEFTGSGKIIENKTK